MWDQLSFANRLENISTKIIFVGKPKSLKKHLRERGMMFWHDQKIIPHVKVALIAIVGLPVLSFKKIIYLFSFWIHQSIDLIESKRGELYQSISKLHIFAVANIVGSQQKWHWKRQYRIVGFCSVWQYGYFHQIALQILNHSLFMESIHTSIQASIQVRHFSSLYVLLSRDYCLLL